ncbi:MAG TPA: CPBP family intramembrane glutamic endopeptidase [Polyangiaceae bacterium]|nr:CPBP family intramembrane glutamic endopeptidase [Polyangiaceae bacterium]
MRAWRLVTFGHAVLTAAALAAAWWARDGRPFAHPDPWLKLDPTAAAAASVLGGALIAALVVWATRHTVARFGWAKRLHVELRPLARGLRTSDAFALALFSGLGEELLFRALALPALGLVASSLLFGAVHQTRGPGRWAWVGWATAVGLGLGLLFALTGSLAGCVLAHALVNAVNLLYLRDHDAEPRRPSLGGLLRRPGPGLGAGS